jgi:hypothetical protein
MIGPVNFEKSVEYWQQDKWNGCFPVKWHFIKDVPNSLLRHITLENNENKPVTNSRDTQEVSVCVCDHARFDLLSFSPHISLVFLLFLLSFPKFEGVVFCYRLNLSRAFKFLKS